MIGLTYPLTAENGSLGLTENYPGLVKNAILSSLNTRLEERVFRPEYGNSAQEFISVNNLVDILREFRNCIDLGLEGYPETSFELFGSASDGGLVELQVIYVCPDGLERSIEITL